MFRKIKAHATLATFTAIAVLTVASTAPASAATTSAGITSDPTGTPVASTTIMAGSPVGVAQDGPFRRIKVELVDAGGRPLPVR